MELFQLYSLVCDHRYSKNVVYRPLARSDAFFLFQAATANPEFNKYLVWDTPKTLADVLVQVDKLLRQTTLNQAYAFSLAERTTGKWIGISVLRKFRDGIEISLYIHPDYWSKGASLAAGSGLIQCVFDHFDVPIYGRLLPGNERIMRIYEYYHFVPTNENDTAYHPTRGKLVAPVYRLDKDRWNTYSNLHEF